MKLLQLASVLAMAASCANPPAPETRSPNVVYILSDTHRWGAMSFTQTPAVQTPNLERLAREGVSFNRYCVNLPLCTPYRAILLTGRWPYQQGPIGNHMALAERVDLPESERHRGTLAWAFKNAGYTTALFGKWHLGGNIALPGVETSGTPRESRNALPFGFDRSVVWWGTNNFVRIQAEVKFRSLGAKIRPQRRHVVVNFGDGVRIKLENPAAGDVSFEHAALLHEVRP